MPSAIEPSLRLKEDSALNKNKKQTFQRTEENLLWLADILMEAESYHRDGFHDKCLDEYKKVAARFEQLNDFETASYFYKKNLDISLEAKTLKGEAEAWMGLGICEEKVHNKYEAMGNLETALEKAIEGSENKLEKNISKELVRVYQLIAQEFQDQGDFDKALNFFDKCLTATQSANNTQ